MSFREFPNFLGRPKSHNSSFPDLLPAYRAFKIQDGGQTKGALATKIYVLFAGFVGGWGPGCLKSQNFLREV